MLQSMTGFGQAEGEVDGHMVRVEIKTLNSKFLDINFRLPKELSNRENEVRAIFQRLLKRGKINGQIEVTKSSASSTPVSLNENLFKQYYTRFKELSSALGAKEDDLFKLALQAPDVMQPQETQTEIDWKSIENLVHTASRMCIDFRNTEAKSLASSLTGYIETIGDRLQKISALDAKRLQNVKDRIAKNLDEIRDRVKVDENRFEQELIYYIEKLDITEEKVRLGQHLKYFMEIMNTGESQGKKLGFVSQEIGREINTIGSKANDPDIQQLVVEMKDELEKIKEQLLNIL